MATPAEYLVRETVQDAQALIAALAQVRAVMDRMVQRSRALGATAVDTYATWPAGYTAQDFKGLINALDSVDMPDSIIPDNTRNRIHKLVANIQ